MSNRNGTVDYLHDHMSSDDQVITFRRAAAAYNKATGRPSHMRVVSSATDREAWSAALAGAVFGLRLERSGG